MGCCPALNTTTTTTTTTNYRPEIVPQSGLAGVEHNIVPHILTAERSQHGKEEIENPEKFDKKDEEDKSIREHLGVLMM